MAATLLLLLLVFSVGGTNAQNGMVVEVTRNRDGDEYFAHNGTSGNYEKRTCPRSTPTLGSGGACQSDISLRNQCKLSEFNSSLFHWRDRNWWVKTARVEG